MLVNIKGFSGESPRTSPNLLPANAATLAQNTNLYSGEIRPFYQPLTVQSFALSGDIKTLYNYNGAYWLTWNEDVDVVLNPLASDTKKRLYFTGTDAPRMTNLDMTSSSGHPTNTYLLGVPRPAGAITAAATGSGGSGTARDVVYLYTYVTSWGEEGPPVATVSNTVTAKSGEVVNLSGLPATYPTNYPNVSKCRIYRSFTGSTTTMWMMVDDVNIGTTTYADSKSDYEILGGTVLPSQSWLGPPSDLVGLTAHPGGFLVGFRANEVWCSVPYYPHAWPTAYMYSIPHTIVGIAVFGDTIAVLTNSYPYLLQGASPASLRRTKFPERQPCISKRGIATYEGGAIYPTPDGLYQISGEGSGSLVTQKSFTRGDWVTYQAQEMHSVIMDRRYYGFYKTGVVGGISQGAAIVVDMMEPGIGLTRLDIYAPGAYVQPDSDQLYLARNISGSNVLQRWEGDSKRLTFTWSSKVYETSPLNWAAGQVIQNTDGGMTQDQINQALAAQAVQIAANQAMITAKADGGSWGLDPYGTMPFGLSRLTRAPAGASDLNFLTFTLIVDGEVAHVDTVTDSEPFTLPAGYVGREVEVRVQGNTAVKRIAIAGSVQELAGGIG